MPAFLSPALPLNLRNNHALLLSKRHAPASVKIARRRRVHIIAANTPDWYKILSVERDATAAEIKRAYRRAALKNHPDVSSAPDAADRFMRVQEAYAVLSDASKRAAYDRRSQFDGWAREGSRSNRTDDFGFDSSEYARQWRERNPMPEDIGDSFSSIFSDLFSNVKSAVDADSPGIMEDFVEFLERNVGAQSADGAEDSLDDVLRSTDETVLACEEEDALFLQSQLKTRGAKLREQIAAASGRAQDWARRADSADRRRDYATRDAARESEVDLGKEVRRLEARLRKVDGMVREQEKRVKKIRKRLDEVRNGARDTSRAGRGGGVTSGSRDGGSRKEAIDEELERMKREMGLLVI